MSKDLGLLVVVVLKARNLNDKHSFYKQDAFASISLNGPQKNTQVDKKGGQHPVWDEEIRLQVPKESTEKNRTLEVSCWAKEHRSDDLLGTGKVDLTETLRTGEFDDWIKLEINGVYRGEVYLEMTFFSNEPTQLIRRPSKLHPNDRLARPQQPFAYPNGSTTSSPPSSDQSSPRGRNPTAQTSPKGNHLLPLPASRSPSSSPRNLNDALPPLPERKAPAQSSSRPQLPTALAAAGGANMAGIGSGPIPATVASAQKVPSILRPGNPKSSPTPVGPSRAVPSPEDFRPILSQTGFPPPPVKIGGMSGSGVPAFPTAAIGHAPLYDGQYNSNNYRQAVDASSDLPDPYLLARYQTPLPLPPGSVRPQAVPVATPRRDPAAEASEIRRQAALAEEQARAKRREQEDADAELARQLDLEFNGGGS